MYVIILLHRSHTHTLGISVYRYVEEARGPRGRGGLQGTRPRAGQLGGPASRGLSVCSGNVSPVTTVRPPLMWWDWGALCSSDSAGAGGTERAARVEETPEEIWAKELSAWQDFYDSTYGDTWT
eukprot:1176111-Prorocentrum_minimum.AAC.1